MVRRLFVLVTALVTVGAVLPAAAGPGTFPDRIPLPDGFFPEGIAIAGHTAYVGSLADGAIVAQDLRTGETTPFAGSPGPDAMAVGMDVDADGRLWVAGGGPALPGKVPAVRVYDTASGALVYERALPGAGFLNDVIVTDDAAWVTNSFVAELVRVPLDGGAIGEPESVPLGGDYVQVPDAFNLNGIVETDGWLVVAQATAPDVAGAALYRVPADASAAELPADRITLDDVLPGADGLVLVGRTLHVVAGAPGVVEVELDGPLTSGTIVGTTEVPESVTPTTAAKFGSRLYVVDAKFDSFGDPAETYDTVAIPR